MTLPWGYFVISRLDAFSQSFKHFKDGYFKVGVKEGGKSHFLNQMGVQNSLLVGWVALLGIRI